MCLTSGLHNRKSLLQITSTCHTARNRAFATNNNFLQLKKATQNTKNPSPSALCSWKSSLKKQEVLIWSWNRLLLQNMISSGKQRSLKKVFPLNYFQNHNSKSDKVLNPVSVQTGKLKLLSNLTFPICSWKCHQNLLIKESQRRTVNSLFLFPNTLTSKR